MKLFVKIKNNPLNPQTSKQASKQKPWTITWSLFQVHSFIMLSPSSFSSYPAHTQQTIMSSVLACELQLICCLFWVFPFNTLLPIVKWKILLPLEKFKVSLSIGVCCSCSVAQSCPTLCDTMDCNMPGFSVLNHLLDLAQTHVRRVDDAIQPCYPLSSPSPSASIFLSIRVFSNELTLDIRWPKYWSFSFTISPSSEYSGFISFRIDWFDLLAVQGILKSLLQHHIEEVWRHFKEEFFSLKSFHNS